MLKFKNLLFALSFLFAPIILTAQILKKEINDPAWMLFNGANNSNYESSTGFSTEPGTHHHNNFVQLANGYTAAIGGKGVIALDENLNIKWNTAIKGIPLVVGKYKDYLIAITSPDIQKLTYFLSNTLDAFLIDPNNGNVILQKNINIGDPKFIEQALFFTSKDGMFFKVGIRKTERKKALDLTPLTKLIKLYSNTQDFTVFDLDEKLEKSKVSTFDIPKEGFGVAQANSKGDIFVRTILPPNSIKVCQFRSGSSAPVKQLEQVINSKSKRLNNKFFVSEQDPYKVYLATLYEGNEGMTLSLAGLNFTEGTMKSETEVITQKNVKELEKNYAVLNKQLSNANLSDIDQMELMNFQEFGNHLFLSLTSRRKIMTSNQSYDEVFGVLLKGYDLSLKSKSQNIIPRKYLSIFAYDLAMNEHNGNLHFIANDMQSLTTNKAIYGQLNIATGTISNLNYLEKQKIDRTSAVFTDRVLWFPNGFLLNYFEKKGGLQLYSYK